MSQQMVKPLTSTNAEPFDNTQGTASDGLAIPKPAGDPWKICLEPLLREDRIRCEAWRDEVQNPLIFAGLFSAVVTAFVIQSCQDLSDTATSDPSVSALAAILNATLMSGSHAEDDIPQGINAPTIPNASAIRVNICWFTSLILALMTVLIGIVSLQWIREYQRYPSNLSPKRAFPARNLRSEGLETWLVPEMFAALPFLLQTALALFLVGLADFLLHLNTIVAIPAVGPIIATLIFLLVTTAAPTLQAFLVLNTNQMSSRPIPIPCPYKSSQSWAFLRLTSSRVSRSIWYTVREIIVFTVYSGLLTPVRFVLSFTPGISPRVREVAFSLFPFPKIYPLRTLSTWDEFDSFWLDARQRLYTKSSAPIEFFSKMVANFDCDAARGIAHVVDGRAQEEVIGNAVYHCFQQLPPAVIGDNVFERMALRLPAWMLSSSARRKCALLPKIDEGMVRAENEMFLLGRLPQTSITHPLHVFRRRQLMLFVKIVAYIFGTDDGRAAPYVCTPSRVISRKDNHLGKLFVPTCLMSVERFNSLPHILSQGIQQTLIDVFTNLARKAASFGNDDYTSELCFQEETLGDFMHLMRVVLMCSLSTDTLPSGRGHEEPVYLSILFVSRFGCSDWPTIKHGSSQLSEAFEDLVETANELGMTAFNFALRGSVYRKQCREFVKEILGAGSASSGTPPKSHIGDGDQGTGSILHIQRQDTAAVHRDSHTAALDPVHFKAASARSTMKIKHFALPDLRRHPVNYCDPFPKNIE